MSKETTPKKKVNYSGFIYLSEREQYRWTIGEWRCFSSEDGKPKCEKLCEKCRSYYV